MEAIGSLTGGVAHDFNNLLMAILSSLELLEKRVAHDARSLKLVDTARQGAERGASLTQRMLAFARRQELNPTTVEISGLVHGLTELLQRSVGPTIEIETRFPHDVKPVFVDPTQLELAILNLVVNARDAMPLGGTITISADARTIVSSTPSLTAGNYVLLSIADDGEGMDEQTLARATDPFFTTKGVGRGSGLGLSMVQGLAEQSQGKLSIRSRKGHGTTVDLMLPVAVAPLASHEPVEQPDAIPELAKPLRVLVVDDDFLIRTNTTAMLEELGHNPIEASSAREALEYLEHQSIDLLIADQAMPKVTGDQLIKEVRRSYPSLPIVLASGYAELPAERPEGVQKLQKPYSLRELEKAVEQATSTA